MKVVNDWDILRTDRQTFVNVESLPQLKTGVFCCLKHIKPVAVGSYFIFSSPTNVCFQVIWNILSRQNLWTVIILLNMDQWYLLSITEYLRQIEKKLRKSSIYGAVLNYVSQLAHCNKCTLQLIFIRLPQWIKVERCGC